MNLRNVLRAYSLLRQLSDDESALLNILRALNDNDREQLVTSMSDKPVKKAGKKSAGGGGKSKRGESLKEQLNKSSQQQRKTTDDDEDVSGERCVYELSYGKCMQSADGNLHHLTSHPNYHAFQPPTPTGKSDAQSAAGGS